MKKNFKSLVLGIALALISIVTVVSSVAYLFLQSNTSKDTFITEDTLVASFSITDEFAGETEGLAPRQNIQRDPKINIEGLEVAAYLFVEVVEADNTLTDGSSLITYTTTSNWVKLDDATAKHAGGTVYVYQVSADNFVIPIGSNLTGVTILEGGLIVADYKESQVDLTKTPKIDFYAYLCQSIGFDSVTEAFNTAF